MRRDALPSPVRSRDAVPTRIAEQIGEAFLAAAEPGVPKHILLRKAVLSCIERGMLTPGDKLPSEQTITATLGVSLGTVRRALEQLAVARVLVREHGHGTFVAEAARAIDDNWHFRFFEPGSDKPLPVYSRLVGRTRVRKAGSWTDSLGADSDGYVLIRRRYEVGGRFLSYSELYLPASRFGALMKRPIESLESVNLKKVLADEFGSPTLYVTQRIRAEALPERACAQMKVEHGTAGTFLRLVGYTFDDKPISHHDVWIPPTREMLDLARMWATDPGH